MLLAVTKNISIIKTLLLNLAGNLLFSLLVKLLQNYESLQKDLSTLIT